MFVKCTKIFIGYVIVMKMSVTYVTSLTRERLFGLFSNDGHILP